MKAKKLGLLGRCLLEAGAVIAGLAAGGCYEELARYQAVNAKDYKQATAINALADMVGAEEKYQRDLDIAREGKSEVNVNVGTGRGYQNIRAPPIYEITNLDTDEKIIYQGNNYFQYINKVKKEAYPKEGFKVFYPEKEGLKHWKIIIMGHEENTHLVKERGEILVQR